MVIIDLLFDIRLWFIYRKAKFVKGELIDEISYHENYPDFFFICPINS